MNFKTIIRPEAESDLEESFQWYQEQSPGLKRDPELLIERASKENE